MALDRRTFLARAGATAAATGLATRIPAPAAAQATALVSSAGAVDWKAVQKLFNLAPDWIHLSSFYLVSHPKPVRDAIDSYRRKLDENPMYVEDVMFAEGHEHAADRVKRRIAAYVGGRPEEIAIVPNTTTGLALLYNGLRLKPGQEILATEHDPQAGLHRVDQVGDADVAVDDQSLHLIEGVLVALVDRFGAEAAAGHDHLERRLEALRDEALHRAHLHR